MCGCRCLGVCVGGWVSYQYDSCIQRVCVCVGLGAAAADRATAPASSQTHHNSVKCQQIRTVHITLNYGRAQWETFPVTLSNARPAFRRSRKATRKKKKKKVIGFSLRSSFRLGSESFQFLFLSL